MMSSHCARHGAVRTFRFAGLELPLIQLLGLQSPTSKQTVILRL